MTEDRSLWFQVSCLFLDSRFKKKLFSFTFHLQTWVKEYVEYFILILRDVFKFHRKNAAFALRNGLLFFSWEPLVRGRAHGAAVALQEAEEEEEGEGVIHPWEISYQCSYRHSPTLLFPSFVFRGLLKRLDDRLSKQVLLSLSRERTFVRIIPFVEESIISSAGLHPRH